MPRSGSGVGFLCLLDESRIEGSRRLPFLACGGLLIELERISLLDEKIVLIRRRAGYPDDVPLKWNAPTESIVDRNSHATAKAELLRCCEAIGAKMFVTLVHASIAAGAAAENRDVFFGWNTVLRSVDAFLAETDDRALVQVDRPSGASPFTYLEEKATRGLIYPGGPGRPETRRSLPRMMGFAAASAKASRIASALDVSLGAFTFTLNPTQGEAVAAVVPAVKSITFKVRLYPVSPRAAYLSHYAEVARILREYGMGAALRG